MPLPDYAARRWINLAMNGYDLRSRGFDSRSDVRENESERIKNQLLKAATAKKSPFSAFSPTFGERKSSLVHQKDVSVVNDDNHQISATLAGNTEAFGELVLRYQDRLFNTVVHVVGNAEDARDIVQEALVQAFIKLETYRKTSAFYTWLYRIAFNVAISFRRRRRPTVAVDCSRDAMGVDPMDHEDGPTERLEQEERCCQVRQALNQLCEEHRAILVLREIDGCCYETIAEILELPVGTVRSRLHRARLQLRDQLKTVLIDEE